MDGAGVPYTYGDEMPDSEYIDVEKAQEIVAHMSRLMDTNFSRTMSAEAFGVKMMLQGTSTIMGLYVPRNCARSLEESGINPGCEAEKNVDYGCVKRQLDVDETLAKLEKLETDLALSMRYESGLPREFVCLAMGVSVARRMLVFLKRNVDEKCGQ